MSSPLKVWIQTSVTPSLTDHPTWKDDQDFPTCHRGPNLGHDLRAGLTFHLSTLNLLSLNCPISTMGLITPTQGNCGG